MKLHGGRGRLLSTACGWPETRGVFAPCSPWANPAFLQQKERAGIASLETLLLSVVGNLIFSASLPLKLSLMCPRMEAGAEKAKSLSKLMGSVPFPIIFCIRLCKQLNSWFDFGPQRCRAADLLRGSSAPRGGEATCGSSRRTSPPSSSYKQPTRGEKVTLGDTRQPQLLLRCFFKQSQPLCASFWGPVPISGGPRRTLCSAGHLARAALGSPRVRPRCSRALGEGHHNL